MQQVPQLEGTSTVVQPKQQTNLFDDKLKKHLRNIALNQLNFFRYLRLDYRQLLTNKKYDQRQECGNTETFWESIIAEYERYMGRLANAKVQRAPITAISLEMELVWRVHLLNPQHYIADCMRQFGRVIGHKCNDPNAVYLTNQHQDFDQKQKLKRTGFISADLIMTEAIKRQCEFIQKMIEMDIEQLVEIDVMTGRVRDQIEGAIDRYEKFMTLMWAPDKPQNLILVPTLAIDLIWHSHQLDPVGYYSFCSENSPNGALVSHDDNIPPLNLEDFRTETRTFWHQKYGADTYDCIGQKREEIENSQKAMNKKGNVKRKLILYAIFLVIGVACVSTGHFVPGIIFLALLCLFGWGECSKAHQGDNQVRSGNSGGNRGGGCGAQGACGGGCGGCGG